MTSNRGNPQGYPKGAIHEAIAALELAYSYLNGKAAVERKLTNALDLLYRAREREEGASHPYRERKHGL